MKTIILCGGKGQRMQLHPQSQYIPKPMQLVNEKPIVHHIMKQYSKYGFNDFILPVGYKAEKIKQYFINFEWINRDFTKDTSNNSITYHSKGDDFKVTIVDTGVDTMTGARIKLVEKYIDSETFMVTYGDGLSDIDVSQLVKFHYEKGKIATLTGVKKKSQYGILEVQNNIAKSFNEKSTEEGIINGGFFVFQKEFLNYLSTDPTCTLEDKPVKSLIEKEKLAIFVHEGLWISIDTQKDLLLANELWKNMR